MKFIGWKKVTQTGQVNNIKAQDWHTTFPREPLTQQETAAKWAQQQNMDKIEHFFNNRSWHQTMGRWSAQLMKVMMMMMTCPACGRQHLLFSRTVCCMLPDLLHKTGWLLPPTAARRTGVMKIMAEEENWQLSVEMSSEAIQQKISQEKMAALGLPFWPETQNITAYRWRLAISLLTAFTSGSVHQYPIKWAGGAQDVRPLLSC